MEHRDNYNALKLLASLAVNGIDVNLKESEKCATIPEVYLCGSIDLHQLDMLVRYTYGILGGE